MSAMSDPKRTDDDEDAILRGGGLPELDPGPDFLAGVQTKIHTRSGGKFYRSRWATSPMSVGVQIVSLAMLLVIILVWLLSGPVNNLEADRPARPDVEESQRPIEVKIRSQGPEGASSE
jgi:hypothetical protein